MDELVAFFGFPFLYTSIVLLGSLVFFLVYILLFTDKKKNDMIVYIVLVFSNVRHRVQLSRILAKETHGKSSMKVLYIYIQNPKSIY